MFNCSHVVQTGSISHAKRQIKTHLAGRFSNDLHCLEFPLILFHLTTDILSTGSKLLL